MPVARSPRNGVPTPKGRRFTAGETAREAGRKGAARSNAAQAERKTLREQLRILLAQRDDAGDLISRRISLALIDQALSGNVRAFEIIRDTIGEKPREQIAVNNPDYTLLDSIAKQLMNK